MKPTPKTHHLPAVRLTEREREAIAARAAALGFSSVSGYIMALIRADIPALDPAAQLRSRPRREKK